jgi:hypothetical protein
MLFFQNSAALRPPDKGVLPNTLDFEQKCIFMQNAKALFSSFFTSADYSENG